MLKLLLIKLLGEIIINNFKKSWLVLAVLGVAAVIFLGYSYNERRLTEMAESVPENYGQAKFENLTKESYSPDKVYVSARNSNIDIYIKGSNEESNNYIGYNIEHLTSEIDREVVASNYDVWELVGANEYERKRKDRFSLTKNVVRRGAWDLALREVGANDFIGGYAHGDEITYEGQFIVDGEEHELESLDISTEADEARLVIHSRLYRDNTITNGNTEHVANRTREFTFNSEGLIIDQSIEFTDYMTLTKSYLAMLPIIREANGLQITDTVKNKAGDDYDVSEPGFDIPEVSQINVDEFGIIGEESGIEATVEILERNNTAVPHSFNLSNSENYNKFYFSYNDNGYEVTPGEIWSTTAHYDINTVN